MTDVEIILQTTSLTGALLALITAILALWRTLVLSRKVDRRRTRDDTETTS